MSARHNEQSLPKGIQRIRALPDPGLGTLWDSIIIEEKIMRPILKRFAGRLARYANIDILKPHQRRKKTFLGF